MTGGDGVLASVLSGSSRADREHLNAKGGVPAA